MQRGFICCKDCTKRVVGCHSTCKKYIEAKKENDKKREELRKQQEYRSEVLHTLYGGRKWHK